VRFLPRRCHLQFFFRLQFDHVVKLAGTLGVWTKIGLTKIPRNMFPVPGENNAAVADLDA